MFINTFYSVGSFLRDQREIAYREDFKRFISSHRKRPKKNKKKNRGYRK